MIKTFKMVNSQNSYDIIENDEILFSILKSNNQVSGEKLYDKIFKDLPINESIKISIIEEGFIDKQDIIIRDRFKELIDKICEKINGTETNGTETNEAGNAVVNEEQK